MISRAVREAKKDGIEDLKSDPKLVRQIDILQRATLSYFNEIKEYPLTLEIQEEELEKLIIIQEAMLKLLRKYRSGDIREEEKRFAKETVHRLSSSLRYLMEDSTERSERDMNLASKYLDAWISNRTDSDVKEMEKLLEDIQALT
ncbi:MAG: hypothetical protein ACLFVP_06380 [Candidatus Bathyarchaeia archaeon]